MSILQLALKWRKLRAKRIEMQKEVDEVEWHEKAVYEEVIEAFRAGKNKSVSNGDRLFQLTSSSEPVVEDFNKLHEYIRETNSFELLQRRVNVSAVKERWENNEVVPGVNSMIIYKISDTKAKDHDA